MSSPSVSKLLNIMFSNEGVKTAILKSLRNLVTYKRTERKTSYETDNEIAFKKCFIHGSKKLQVR